MKEKGFPLIESLMFDEHDMVKRAATECMCNMVLCEEVTMLLDFTRSLVNCDRADKRFAFERGTLVIIPIPDERVQSEQEISLLYG